MRSISRRLFVSFVASTLVLVACSPAADEGADTTQPESTTTTGADTTTTEPATTTTETETTTTTPTTTTIPGEIIDFGPMAGDQLMVIGVAHDDVLNLRAAPGPSQEILDMIEPTHMDLIAEGETRQIPGAFWIKVDYEGTVGWVHMSYIGYEGLTDDMTSAVVDELGEYPTAETMIELGQIVAESLASEEPRSDIVLVVDETVGDLGEVTYDVIGLGDDAVRGLRVHVFGQPVSDGFSLKSVEVTSLCGRGVTAEGLCP